MWRTNGIVPYLAAPVSFKRLLGGNNILALDEAAGVMTRGDVLKRDVTFYCAEERDPTTDEDGNARDDEAVNEPGLKKPLNRDPAIHVNVSDAPSCKLHHDVRWRPGHALHRSAGGCRSERMSAEHKHRLRPIGPGAKGQDSLERLAPDDYRIHRGHELIVAVWFATARFEKIELTVGPSDEAVEAGANKDGCFHCTAPMLPPNGSRLSCGRLARRRKISGRTSRARQSTTQRRPLKRECPPA